MSLLLYLFVSKIIISGCLFILLLSFLKNNRYNPKVINENKISKQNPTYDSDSSSEASTTSTNKTVNRIFVNNTYEDPHGSGGIGH